MSRFKGWTIQGKRNFRESIIHVELVRYLDMMYKHRNIIIRTDLSGINLDTTDQDGNPDAQKLQRVKQMHNLSNLKKFPDLTIYEPSGKYSGLFLELKKESEHLINKRRVTWKTKHIRGQAESLGKLAKKGYWTSFAIGLQHAIDIVRHYMSQDFERLHTITIGSNPYSAEYFDKELRSHYCKDILSELKKK